MPAFVGKFERALDDKGRLVLPSKLREHLDGRGILTLVEPGCLGLWPPEAFDEVSGKLAELARGDRDKQVAYRKFLSECADVRPDGQGRVTLPEDLVEQAGLSGDVIVNGSDNRIEIWDAARGSEVSSGSEPVLTDMLAEVGF